MIPYLLAAVGGYLIGDSIKDSQTFADGGYVSEKEKLLKKAFEKEAEYEVMGDEIRGVWEHKINRHNVKIEGWIAYDDFKEMYVKIYISAEIDGEWVTIPKDLESDIKNDLEVEIGNIDRYAKGGGIEGGYPIKKTVAKIKKAIDYFEKQGDTKQVEKLKKYLKEVEEKMADGGQIMNLSSFQHQKHDIEIEVEEMSSKKIVLEVEMTYADDKECEYLLTYSIDYDNDNFSLDSGKNKDTDEKFSKEELKAIANNKKLTEMLDNAVSEAMSKYQEAKNEPDYDEEYAKGGSIDEDLDNFDISQLDAYESMQYKHFTEKGKMSKKEALQVLINSVDEDYSQLSPKLRTIARRKYRIGGEINKGDRFYYTKSGKKELAVVEDIEGDNIKIFINHPESHNKGRVYSKDKHITVPRQEVRNYGTPIRSQKFEYEDGGSTSVAMTILQQLGGRGRLTAMTGAYNFYDIGNGLSFKIKNPRANYIKIKLNGKDLYDVEVGRIRGTTYKVVAEQNDLYFDQLKNFIEKATGMYLSL